MNETANNQQEMKMKTKTFKMGDRVETVDGSGTVACLKRTGNEAFPKTHIPVNLDNAIIYLGDVCTRMVYCKSKLIFTSR